MRPRRPSKFMKWPLRFVIPSMVALCVSWNNCNWLSKSSGRFYSVYKYTKTFRNYKVSPRLIENQIQSTSTTFHCLSWREPRFRRLSLRRRADVVHEGHVGLVTIDIRHQRLKFWCTFDKAPLRSSERPSVQF